MAREAINQCIRHVALVLAPRFACVLVLDLLAGCATLNADPFEPINREVFEFNTSVARAIGAGEGSDEASVAAPVLDVAKNVLSNLREPMNFANAVLQGRDCAAGVALRRFLTNSTIGLAGTFDVAKTYGGLDAYETDAGETLGIWGLPPGPYLTLPLLGPANARGIAGFTAEYFLDPVDYGFARAGWNSGIWTRAGSEVAGLAIENADATATAVAGSVDGYTRQRDEFMSTQRQRLAGYECPAALQGSFWSDTHAK